MTEQTTPRIDLDVLMARAQPIVDQVIAWLSSPKFYGQIGFIFGAILVAWVIARGIHKRVKAPNSVPLPGGLGDGAPVLAKLLNLLFPVLRVLALAIAAEISRVTTTQGHIAQVALAISVIFLVRAFVRQFISNPMIIFLINWIIVPAALLNVFGWLDDVTEWLQGISLAVGNIKLSAYALVRTFVFGAFLFWLGRLSNDTGKRVIREQKDLDLRTREIVSKLFEIILFVAVFLILLQIMGINLTTLAVFGGAIGVGLGFGLQQIASNFISGIILLLDKSLTIGDYIELEDGRGGVIRELSLRSATVETFDGKDIMVPNETFITTSFTNWTHYDQKQRYSFTFSVAYSTDLNALFDLVREKVAAHPQVLSGPDYTAEEQPDAEIDEFGDSGISVLVEYWMMGLDDGKNRVDADLKLAIWQALKDNGFSMPFPQREIRILDGKL